MAKNNFKAKEATSDANYAQNIGTMGQAAAGTGLEQQAQGFSNLQDTFGQQKSFAQMLQDAAEGKGGPTMADQQIKDATARNNANAAGFAAGAKGLNPALAARQALMAQAGNNQQAAGQAAQTRVQEQLAAREQLGGALAGEAGTAGGMTSAGQGLYGTGGSLANQSNQNLINSRQGANQINADVAKQNTGITNGIIGGLASAAGGIATGGMSKLAGLAEGGVVPGETEGTQNDETSIALAKGGAVPAEPALHTSLPKAAGVQPHRSFAAQVAHHLSREYFAEGGMASQPGAHDSYDFGKGMNLRDVKPKKPKSEGGADTTMFIPHDYHPSQPSNAGAEGQDSEGHEKPSINRAFGGPAQPSGDAPEAQDEYNPADDEPEADDRPDTDQGIDPDEAEEKGIPRYADGGPVGPTDPTGADESAGLSMAPAAPSTATHPSAFARIGAGLEALGQGIAHPSDSPMPQMVNAGPSVAQRQQAAGPTTRLPTRKPVLEPGGAPAPLMGDRSGAPFTTRLKFEAGGGVPGKAKVDGDSYANDTVDAKLSPGEVVLPRSISHDPEKAKRFVEHLMQHGSTGHEALAAIKGKRKS